MSLGFPIKVDWDGPEDLPEVIILPTEVSKIYLKTKDIWEIFFWLENNYGWCINEVELL